VNIAVLKFGLLFFCIAIITALCIQCCILLLIYALCIDQVASW
jgi:hypothetical protein